MLKGARPFGVARPPHAAPPAPATLSRSLSDARPHRSYSNNSSTSGCSRSARAAGTARTAPSSPARSICAAGSLGQASRLTSPTCHPPAVATAATATLSRSLSNQCQHHAFDTATSAFASQLCQAPSGRLRDTVHYVKAPTGKTITIQTPSRNTSIDTVKKVIQQMEGNPPDQQVLMYAGVQLDGHHTLAECNIDYESTLLLVSRQSGGMYHYSCDQDDLREVPDMFDVTVLLEDGSRLCLPVRSGNTLADVLDDIRHHLLPASCT